MTESSAEIIAFRPSELYDPVQGELVPIDAPSERLGRLLEDVRELESNLRVAKRHVSEELLRRMDARANWTLREGPFEISGQSPAPKVEYDAQRLLSVLRALADDGVIDPAAVEGAVKETVDYKPVVRGINALKKLGGQVAREIDACGQEVTRERRVQVKRAGA